MQYLSKMKAKQQEFVPAVATAITTIFAAVAISTAISIGASHLLRVDFKAKAPLPSISPTNSIARK